MQPDNPRTHLSTPGHAPGDLVGRLVRGSCGCLGMGLLGTLVLIGLLLGLAAVLLSPPAWLLPAATATPPAIPTPAVNPPPTTAPAALAPEVAALATVLLVVLALFLLIGGGVVLFIHWYLRGRDLPVGRMALMLREPPDDLPPAVVGALVDERVDLHDVLSTIPWLGSRGVLRAHDLLGGREVVLEQVAGESALLPYERSFLGALFGAHPAVRLRERRARLEAHLPEITCDIEEELVRRGLVHAAPAAVRSTYRRRGLLLAAFATMLGLLVFAGGLGEQVPAAYGPAGSLLLLGIIIAVMAPTMPRRTRRGALAAARWRAFGRYLREIERHENLVQADAIFARYLPYAVAFGLEAGWFCAFSQRGATAPAWYERHKAATIPPRQSRDLSEHDLRMLADVGSDVLTVTDEARTAAGQAITGALSQVSLPDLSQAGQALTGLNGAAQGLSDGVLEALQHGSDGAISTLGQAAEGLLSLFDTN